MTNIEVISNPVPLTRLTELADKSFGDMVKCVVDLEKGTIAAGAELHADEEALLLDQGSRQENLWGFNIYVHEPRESWLEYNSMVNIKPSQNNFSRDLQSEEIKNKIAAVVGKLVQ